MQAWNVTGIMVLSSCTRRLEFPSFKNLLEWPGISMWILGQPQDEKSNMAATYFTRKGHTLF